MSWTRPSGVRHSLLFAVAVGEGAVTPIVEPPLGGTVGYGVGTLVVLLAARVQARVPQHGRQVLAVPAVLGPADRCAPVRPAVNRTRV